MKYVLVIIFITSSCYYNNSDSKQETTSDAGIVTDKDTLRVELVEMVDFKSDVKPILIARCSPCHFPGGKMHTKLPFDSAQTILKLGDHLFTRIKDEEEQATLKNFLAQYPEAEPH